MKLKVVGHEKSAIECAADRCMASGIPFARISPVGISGRIDLIEDGRVRLELSSVWTFVVLAHGHDLADSSLFARQPGPGRRTGADTTQQFRNSAESLATSPMPDC